VGATALLAPQGGSGDEGDGFEDISQLNRGERRLADRPKGGGGQGCDGRFEAIAIAQDAAMLPGEIAQLRDRYIRHRPDGAACVRGRRRGLSAHGATCAGSEHKTFQQRITGQTIGAVNAAARDFAGGVQACNRSAAFEIGVDASHCVMGGGVYWRGFGSEIEAKREARFIDAREALMNKFAAAGGEIEPYVRRIGAFHLRNDRA
jgi:hypothetical protein